MDPFRNDTLSAGQRLDFFIWAHEWAERPFSPLSESEETQIQQRNPISSCQCQHNNVNKSAKRALMLIIFHSTAPPRGCFCASGSLISNDDASSAF